ncbi:RNA polymerase sigma factor [Agrococcus jejuensis]|uniref:RNA polymerase sigma-70 factor, ECF subfamily n=1 Tax=Agrococcus jejuensis TaxID=399736 RepID=A0A1G8FLI6_9MICO|nr:sigma-70 family RNA polymerase sigma factor [Agrococcus jejuensis]SDH82948.1 RNA polymerase sigma-70 factor, ECF subfamily [Agrococcus jejuensis]
MTGAGHVERVLEAAAPTLLGYFVRRTTDPHDAADLVSETFVAAWRARRRMPADDEQARMWLFGVARNVLRHHERSHRRRTAATVALGQALAAAPAPADGDDARDVRAALETLPEQLAELVRLVHWDGLSLEQAATLLRIPASTARGRHARAKALLRAALEPPSGAARTDALETAHDAR